MPKINKDRIKEALDLFENDKYFECREILKEEISTHKNAFLSEELGVAEEESVLDENTDLDVE